ncbi:hypothetical protein OEZ86_008416 [Tetradesmus obliquus]|nr:hypothetical protein OEZ86_008416 [Tetradesmus obliquus]
MEARGNGALPPLPALPARHMAGPTPFSNWVIPGQLIAGAYPASMDDNDTERILTLLLELGINTFVCLQAEVNIHIPDHAWRAGMGLRPYIKDAQRILSRAHEANSSRIKQRKIDFLHLPIIDGSVTTDMAMSRLADDCCERVLRGEKMYIHCWGGHGRTGTLVATMLGRLYGLPYSTALRYTQGYHDTRVYPQGVRSPQTAVQRAQVRRLLLIPSPIPAIVLSAAASSGNNISKTTAAGSPVTLSDGGTGNATKKISGLLKSSSSSLKEPGTAASAAASSPSAPTKQQISRPRSSSSTPKSPLAAAMASAAGNGTSSSSSSPYNWTPPAAAPRATAPGTLGSISSTSSASKTLFSSTAACRASPASAKRAPAGSLTGAYKQSNSFSSGGQDSSSIKAAGSLMQQAELSKQQQLAGTALVMGIPLATVSAALKGSSSSISPLRMAQPRTPPVQTHIGISSSNSLVKRSLNVKA